MGKVTRGPATRYCLASVGSANPNLPFSPPPWSGLLTRRRAFEATSATPTLVTDPLAAIAALNGLEIAIADEEARGEAPPIGEARQ